MAAIDLDNQNEEEEVPAEENKEAVEAPVEKKTRTRKPRTLTFPERAGLSPRPQRLRRLPAPSSDGAQETQL